VIGAPRAAGQRAAPGTEEAGAVPGQKNERAVTELRNVIIRFAGDSGDGIQLTGGIFSHDSAAIGHDISTLPDYPAEIRAPVGTLAGVSSFQLNFSSYDIHTPGDRPDVLVALNPAALKAHLADLRSGGIIILNEDAFAPQNLKKAEYDADPRSDDTLAGYQVHELPITSLTEEGVAPAGLGKKQAGLCKNMFTLGIVCWLYDRSLQELMNRVDVAMRGKNPQLAEANRLALQAGYNLADTMEIFMSRYRVGKADLPAGKYRRVSGNEALALGFLAAQESSGRPLVYASYPITPASDILHELSKLRHFGVRTVQAEDEIAAMGMAIGAAYGGSLGLTGTSGPGIALKSEGIGLAVMAELPVVVVNVQRAGPSTGMPTKTEQADLLQAMFGRNGECPAVVLAPATPADCFAIALEAFRIAIKYMTPVIVLSDGYIANGSEPWRIPGEDALPRIDVELATEADGFAPYARDPDTLSRPWAVPGTAGLEHRIGGIEKEDGSGNVSYDSLNHEKMVNFRADKVAGISTDVPPLEVFGPERGDLLVVGWGSSSGAIQQAVDAAQQRGLSVAAARLRYLNPFPANLEGVLRSYERVLVPELNLGQLRMMLRSHYLINVIGLNKVQGQPFRTSDIEEKIYELLDPRLDAAAGQ
jgi:2-oxoglutarate ferredoxin oxidoreductase subunit alpha